MGVFLKKRKKKKEEAMINNEFTEQREFGKREFDEGDTKISFRCYK